MSFVDLIAISMIVGCCESNSAGIHVSAYWLPSIVHSTASVRGVNGVGPRYFETVGIPVSAGRDFRDEDNPAVSEAPPATLQLGVPRSEPPGPRVAIINESLARRFLAGRNPIGLRLCLLEKYDAARAYAIVVAVKDAHYFGLW